MRYKRREHDASWMYFLMQAILLLKPIRLDSIRELIGDTAGPRATQDLTIGISRARSRQRGKSYHSHGCPQHAQGDPDQIWRSCNWDRTFRCALMRVGME
jgi:hypothetical protein